MALSERSESKRAQRDEARGGGQGEEWERGACQGGGRAPRGASGAAAAVAGGMADCVVVFRALAQGQFARFGQGPQTPTVSGEAAFTAPYGLIEGGADLPTEYVALVEA